MKSFAAHEAGVRRLARVDPPVYPQMGHLCKSLLAYVALVRLLAGVDHFVLL